MGRFRIVGSVVLVCIGMAFGLPSSAAATTTQMIVPVFPPSYPDACTDDTVFVTGAMHMTAISSGTKVEVQTNWQDTSGVGLPSGTTYQPNDANHFYILSVPKGQVTIGLRDSFELVSLDKNSNLLVHELLSITFFNGAPTDVRMQGGATCSGPTPP